MLSMPGNKNTHLRTYPDARPVFIVGCVRSGTSAIMRVLREKADYRGFSEGGVAPLLHKLRQTVDRHYAELPEDYRQSKAHMISKIEASALKDLLSSVMGMLLHEVMGSGRWLDKTPSGADMVRSCPALMEVFPQARFIFCKRRGIENILSRQRKFPDAPFAQSCHSWADTMHAWMEVRPRLQGKYLEVDQRDMAIHSEKVARMLGELLELDGPEIEGIGEGLRTGRVEQTRPVQDSRYLGLEETGWKEVEKQQFKAICQPMMQAYGYRLEGGSEEEARPVPLFYPLEGSANAIEKRNVKIKDYGFSAVDSNTLQLHPNPPGEGAAEVRYLRIPLNGHSRFIAELMLENEKSDPVVYGLRIEESEGHRPVASAQQVVPPGSRQDWLVELPILRGIYDVVISTEMAEGAASSNCAWARWKNARVA